MAETSSSAWIRRMSLRRAGTAFGLGAIATIVMGALMGASVLAGVSPLPKPIPAALVGQTIGPLPQAALLPLAFVAHLVYGGVAAVVLAAVTRRVTLAGGLLWGGALWLVAGLVWLPVLGWGPFGIGQAMGIAVATLVLHLVYGAVLGGLARRSAPIG